ncbi:MAG: galactose mutarotase [Bacteroidales bacterium]|nr:galactose mutarotase [Bacteroidales bacterium]
MRQFAGLTIIFLLSSLIFTGCNIEQKKQKTQEKMNMKRTLFGETDGNQIYQYTFTNINSMSVSIINYGGIVTHLIVPDREGNLQDVVLGYDNLQQYLDNNSPYFGAIAGRYANRIARGKFSIDGTEYQLATNNGTNHLHGGLKGFDKVVWDVEDFIFPDSAGVVLTYHSPDGEEGYPGNLLTKVIYTLNNNNELRIDYQAETDQPTVLNLTHHSYFNLKGQGNGNIYNHQLQIFADHYIPVDETLIPTGELNPVEGTLMDFTAPMEIGKGIHQVDGGYDHTFVLNNFDGNVREVARVIENQSGRLMKVFTDQPGMQFYSGNFLDGSITGKESKVYMQHYGFCLETQHFPDSPNQPAFPPTLLRPGEKYQTTTIYRFEVFD